MPIFAPLLVPPCFMVSVAALKTVINDIGPLETPLVESTTSFFGLILEKEYPTPPPDFCIRAVSLSVSNISDMESPTGRTKHAASCWSSFPAFISVGELGRKSRSVIISKKSFSISRISFSVFLYFFSAEAIFRATLANISPGFSRRLPPSSLFRYLLSRTFIAFSDRVIFFLR